VEVAVEAKGKSTYAGVVGKGILAKSEHVVPPPQVPEFDRGSLVSKSKSQNIPQNPTQSKTCLPLRFFPNQNPPSQNRKFVKGLTITLNENGILRLNFQHVRLHVTSGCPKFRWWLSMG
jgi:hypothetical protein